MLANGDKINFNHWIDKEIEVCKGKKNNIFDPVEYMETQKKSRVLYSKVGHIIFNNPIPFIEYFCSLDKNSDKYKIAEQILFSRDNEQYHYLILARVLGKLHLVDFREKLINSINNLYLLKFHYKSIKKHLIIICDKHKYWPKQILTLINKRINELQNPTTVSKVNPPVIDVENEPDNSSIQNVNNTNQNVNLTADEVLNEFKNKLINKTFIEFNNNEILYILKAINSRIEGKGSDFSNQVVFCYIHKFANLNSEDKLKFINNILTYIVSYEDKLTILKFIFVPLNINNIDVINTSLFVEILDTQNELLIKKLYETLLQILSTVSLEEINKLPYCFTADNFNMQKLLCSDLISNKGDKEIKSLFISNGAKIFFDLVFVTRNKALEKYKEEMKKLAGLIINILKTSTTEKNYAEAFYKNYSHLSAYLPSDVIGLAEKVIEKGNIILREKEASEEEKSDDESLTGEEIDEVVNNIEQVFGDGALKTSWRRSEIFSFDELEDCELSI